MEPPLINRALAAQLLAVYLRQYGNNPDVLVLGLPRGGIPVAYEVALALRVRMKALLVRKLGVPGSPELAFGAVCSTGDFYLDQETIAEFGLSGDEVETILANERKELEKRAHFYGDHSAFPDVHGKVVIVVDDGIATGSTMLAAVRTLRKSGAEKIVVAAPVGSAAACEALRKEADAVVCALRPTRFVSVGQWYKDFRPVEDTEVLALLRQQKRWNQRP